MRTQNRAIIAITTLFKRLRRRDRAMMPSASLKTWEEIDADAFSEVLNNVISQAEQDIVELEQAMRGQN
jgi:hypothetical protein